MAFDRCLFDVVSCLLIVCCPVSCIYIQLNNRANEPVMSIETAAVAAAAATRAADCLSVADANGKHEPVFQALFQGHRGRVRLKLCDCVSPSEEWLVSIAEKQCNRPVVNNIRLQFSNSRNRATGSVTAAAAAAAAGAPIDRHSAASDGDDGEEEGEGKGDEEEEQEEEEEERSGGRDYRCARSGLVDLHPYNYSSLVVCRTSSSSTNRDQATGDKLDFHG